MSSTISGIDVVQTLVQSEVDYAGEFLRMLDEYHGRPEKFDDKLMAEYHRMMAELEVEVLKVEASSKPDFIKRNHRQAYEEILAIIEQEVG